MKEVTSKRKKVDADYERMAEIEFKAGLYMSADGPVIPDFMIEATLINAAKKVKEGTYAKSGVFCQKLSVLQYDGPRTAEELWKDERFRFSAIVRVQNARIARMRPIFREWKTIVEVNLDDEVINPSRVVDWFKVAGSLVGVGDWRPKYGRFLAERVA